jgi:hypothetical protein
MTPAVEFLLGLLDLEEPVCLGWEDIVGPHARAVRLWQRMGIVRREPAYNPARSCPECGEGTPYRVGGSWRCDRCRSVVDDRHLLLWPFDAAVFFRWLTRRLGLRGEARPIDGRLWQLGTGTTGGVPFECFCLRGQTAGGRARALLAAYQNVVVLYGLARPRLGHGYRAVSLLPVLSVGRSMSVNRAIALGGDRAVRFDAGTGTLWAGGRLLGEVPLGSKEYHFLRCLADRLDRFVPYSDIKRYVRAASGSHDSTDEATFCQLRKSRIKRRCVPDIDRLIDTTNKGDGYRLRGQLLMAELLTAHGHWLKPAVSWWTSVDWGLVGQRVVGA